MSHSQWTCPAKRERGPNTGTKVSTLIANTREEKVEAFNRMAEEGGSECEGDVEECCPRYECYYIPQRFFFFTFMISFSLYAFSSKRYELSY